MGLFNRNQQAFDSSRDVYQIIAFPTPLKEDRVGAWLRSIGMSLKAGGAFSGFPTIVFEVVTTSDGIQHLIRVPKGKNEYLLKQLHTAVPGLGYMQIKEESTYHFDYGVEMQMHNRARRLAVADVSDYANRVLSSMQDAVEEGDQLVLQWIIAHYKPKPVSANAPATNASVWSRLMGNTQASDAEISDRRAKQADQIFYATGRIGARAKNPARAARLVNDVVTALTSEAGAAYFKPKVVDPEKLSYQMEFGETPLFMRAELSTTELMSVMAWPLGEPNTPGLYKSPVQHKPVPDFVPSKGITLGVSTIPGSDRTIALDESALVTHAFIGGATEVGKTTLMTNIYRQAVLNGHGAVIIEYDGNLIHRALEQTPRHRLDDAIVIDIASTNKPVGLNILKLGSGTTVAAQVIEILEAIYPDMRSIYMRKLLAHIIPALEVIPNATIADIMVIASPQNQAERQWANWVVEQQADPTIKEFLSKWLSPSNDRDRERNVQPLENRIWELLTPKESRYMITQETSSFDPIDVIKNNRLLFVNLAGLPESIASLIGTFIVSAIWRAARQVTPERANLMFIDEFQYFSRNNSEFADMLAVARRRKLGLYLATQYIERLDQKVQDAIGTNARTKIIFQSGPKSASIYARDFADKSLESHHFQNLPAYTAIARIKGPAGTSSPITMRTLPEPQPFGLSDVAVRLSEAKHGRAIESIEAAEKVRRRVPMEKPREVAPNDDPFRKKLDQDDHNHTMGESA